MNKQDSRYVQSIANIIKKLQSCSLSKKETYRSKVKKQFKMEDNEKWVVTKLRMILFRLNVDIEHFQIPLPRKSSPKKQYSSIKHSKRETVIIKAQKLKEKKDEIFVGNVDGNRIRQLRTKENKRRGRPSLEDKQLSKLRSVTLEAENFNREYQQSSKLIFLKSLNLISNV